MGINSLYRLRLQGLPIHQKLILEENKLDIINFLKDIKEN